MAKDEKSGGLKSLADELPLDKLKDELQNGLGLLGQKALGSVGDKITDLTDRLTDVADGGGVAVRALLRRLLDLGAVDRPGRLDAVSLPWLLGVAHASGLSWAR